MSTMPAHRFPSGTLLGGLPNFAPLRPLFGSHTIRVEEEDSNGRHVVRAELPGMDPHEDITVTVDKGLLSIQARRAPHRQENGRSEFSYGEFTRAVRLPAGAHDNDVKADYCKGILTVSVGVDPTVAPHKVPITPAE